MNPTRLLMSASALVLGVLALPAIFAPDHVLHWLGAPVEAPLLLVIQVLGALYIGFAALNWMTRHNLIGGIYSRPLAVGNLMHFLVAGLAMVKLVPQIPMLWLLAIVYAGFAVAFGAVLFRHPVPAKPAGPG